MADDIILLDGVRYLRFTPETEAEFERMVVEHASEIFGKDTIYLDIKKKIKTEWGQGTIPDGYLFYPEEKRFVLGEVELSSHDVHSHVSRKLATFIGAFGNYRSRNKLAKLVQRHIEEDPQLRDRLDKAAKGKGLFDFLYNEVFEAFAEDDGFETIVVIERETPQILGAMKLLMPHPKVLEVAIYAREGAESVKAIRFVPMYTSRTTPEELPKEKPETAISEVDVPWNKEDFRDLLLGLCEGAKLIFWFVAKSEKPIHKTELDQILKKILTWNITSRTTGAFLGAFARKHKHFPGRPYPFGNEWKLYSMSEEMSSWTIEILTDFAKEKGLLK